MVFFLNNLLPLFKADILWVASNLFPSQFAHPASPEAETRNRDTCTTTGTMLTQVQSSLPEAFNFRRYPKYRTHPVGEPYRLQSIWCLLLPSFSFPVHCRNPESSRSPNMTTSRPSWTSPSLETSAWAHSRNCEGTNHNCATVLMWMCVCLWWGVAGSGPAKKYQPSQTPHLPLLLVPRGGRQRPHGEQQRRVGLQSWLHRKGGDRECARQRQAIYSQPQTEVCRDGFGADGTVHVVWTARLFRETSSFKHVQAKRHSCVWSAAQQCLEWLMYW